MASGNPHSLKSIHIQEYGGISNAAPPNLGFEHVYGDSYIVETLFTTKFRVCPVLMPMWAQDEDQYLDCDRSRGQGSGLPHLATGHDGEGRAFGIAAPLQGSTPRKDVRTDCLEGCGGFARGEGTHWPGAQAEELRGCRCVVSQIRPTSFFQVNTPANELLIQMIRDMGAITPSTLVLDLCCGTGVCVCVCVCVCVRACVRGWVRARARVCAMGPSWGATPPTP